MKILLINKTDNKGGAARFTYGLMKELQKKGHEVSMFVRNKYSNDENIFEIRKQNNFIKALSSIINIDLHNIFHNKINWLLSNDIEHFNNNGLLYSTQLEEADIVHCNNLHGSYFNLALLEKISRKKPVIWSLHDMWALTPHSVWTIKNSGGEIVFDMGAKPELLWNNKNHLFEKKRAIYSKSRLFVVGASEWIMDRISNSPLKGQSLHLIKNGIRTDIFKMVSKDSARERLSLPKDKKIITFMSAGGKHNEQKGWGYAEKVMKHYKDKKDILFLCIGGSSKDRALDNKNVKYIEYIENEELFALHYSASDIFMHTSLAEAFCLVVIEAMSAGIPVVSFPVGIVPNAVQHKVTGYVAEYMSSEDLIRGIEWVLGLNAEELKELGKRSRGIVEKNFNTNKMLDEYINLYKKALMEY